jgi:tripartite-type tricarboxylate transporter receptor subunit TctC
MIFVTRAISLCAMLSAALSLSLSATPAKAADAFSLHGKTVTFLVGSRPGGSTDVTARLIAPYLAKYLPGKPVIVVQNMPGAQDIVAMNYFAQRVKPDGLEIILGSSSQFDPVNYRIPQSKYDPTNFVMVGGLDIGGTSVIVRNDALTRLTKKSTPQLAMGTVGSYPHVGMMMVAWGIADLGWNVKWVPGYSNNSDLALALERGEIDLTSLANAWLSQNPAVLDKSKFTLVYQTGSEGGTVPSPLPGIAEAPLFSSAIKGKIDDPLAKAAYEYWRDLSYVFKWVALPPKTPEAIAETYRAAFQKVTADPEFKRHGEEMNPGLGLISASELTTNVNDLAKVPPEAMNYMTQLLRKQGLSVEAAKEKKHKKTKKD